MYPYIFVLYVHVSAIALLNIQFELRGRLELELEHAHAGARRIRVRVPVHAAAPVTSAQLHAAHAYARAACAWLPAGHGLARMLRAVTHAHLIARAPELLAPIIITMSTLPLCAPTAGSRDGRLRESDDPGDDVCLGRGAACPHKSRERPLLS